MNRVPIPDNLHFYKKNDNNFLSVNIILTGDQSIGLDYSKSIGQSEVALTLLGLPREEMRQVLYEDVPSYGFDRGRWNAIVRWNKSEVHYYDVNAGNQAQVVPRLVNRRVDIAAGQDSQYFPAGLNFPCPQDGLQNRQKYFIPATFAPIIYQDPENTSITMEAWPAKDHIYVYVENPCNNPTKYVVSPWFEDDYLTRLESKETYRYEPGKIMGMTFGIATSVEGVSGKRKSNGSSSLKTATWGAENNTDSYYFKLRGTQLFVGRRSIYAQNSVEISRSQFIDPLDGKGKSGARIDFSKVTMYALEFSWYGAIGCTFYAYLPYGEKDTKWVKLAELPASNTFSVPALADPYMRMFMEMQVPHGVTSPQFFRKHGTSVYVDGGSVDSKKVFSKNAGLATPVKLTTGDSKEGRNVLSVKMSEKNASAAAGQFNKTKIFPIDIQAFFDSSVYLDIDVTIAPKYDLDYVRNSASYPSDGEPNRYINYPIKIWEAEKPLPNALFFSDFSRGFVTPGAGPPNGSTSGSGASGQFYESYYDFILPLASSIVNSNNDPGKFTVSVPGNYNISEVARSLLNTIPLLYDQSLASRTTYAYDCFKLFRPELHGIGPTFGVYPNWVYGLETLPIVTSVKRIGSNILECECKDSIISNSDGTFITNFNPSTELTTPLAIYPSYTPNHHGNISMVNRVFGGYKMVPPGAPLYNSATSKVCLKKDFYRNDSFYIFNAPFDTGRVYFNYPLVPSSIFCIQKPFVDFLISKNWFQNKELPFQGTFNRSRDNALSYLIENSEFRFLNEPIHTTIDDVTNVQGYGVPPYFVPTDKFYWYPDEWWRWLKDPYRPRRAIMDSNISTYQLKYIDYKLYEGTGAIANFGEVQANPGEPFEGPGSKNRFITPSIIATEKGIVGFEINRFTFRIRLRPEARVSNLKTKNLGGNGKRYKIVLEDLQYLNKDNVFTCSNTFFLIFLNNLHRLTGCNRLTLLPNIDLTFNAMWLEDSHLSPGAQAEPITQANFISPFKIKPNCRVAFSFVNGNPPPSNFFTESQNIDFYGIYVDIPDGLTGVNYEKIQTLEGEFRTVTCLHNQTVPSDTLFKDDLAAANTFIIGSSGAPFEPQIPLYFGFSINTSLSAMNSGPMMYQTGLLNILNTPAEKLQVGGTRTGYDMALAINNMELTDFHGNKVDNLGPLYANKIKELPIFYTGDGKLNPSVAQASLSSTKWANNYNDFSRLRAQTNVLNNDNINSVQSLKKVSYLVLANKKTKITLNDIFGLSKTQILPVKYGNAFPYDTFLNVSVRTAVPGVKAKGMVTMNFEETV